MLLLAAFQQPTLFIAIALALLVALAVHEYAHALAADQLGDDTPRHLGRLTLNPIAHIDGMGLLMILLVGFGWGKPVPINPVRLKYAKWGEAIVAIAGPLSNLVLIFLFGGILWVIAQTGFLAPSNLLVAFLGWSVTLNVILMLFNLIPIPPLDGSKVLFAFLPHTHQADVFRDRYERQGPMLLFGLLILDYVFNLGIFAFLFSGIVQVTFNFFLA